MAASPQIKIVKSPSIATPDTHFIFVYPIVSRRRLIPMEVISITNAEHYTWPSAISSQACDGWHLHRSAGISVIEERMQSNTAECRHLHQHSMQFFYVLSGELTIELNGAEHLLLSNTGLTIPIKTPHQVFNRSAQDVRFLVISQPPSHGDRIPADSSGS